MSNNLDVIYNIFQVKEIEELAPKLIETINGLGFRTVRVIMIEGPNRTLQFMIERADLTDITIKECVKLSRVISEMLDEKDLIKDDYALEVSSPGIERPIIQYSDYLRFKGSMVKINLKERFNNKIKFNAYIKKCGGDKITFVDSKDKEVMVLPFSLISNAKLLFNDF